MMAHPYIWVPKFRILEPKRELSLPIGTMRGYFRMEAGKRDGRRRTLTEWFPNLIVDGGLDYVGGVATGQNLSTCYVGTGTSAPDANDTALATSIASTDTLQANSRSAQSEAPFYAAVTRTWRFGEGAAAGNLAEVGVGTADVGSSGVLWSRARILDAESNPTTITVLSDEFLDVVYQLRLYPPTDDVESTINLGSSDLVFDYVVRASIVNSSAVWGLLGHDALSGGNRQDGFAMGCNPAASNHRVLDTAMVDNTTAISVSSGDSASSSTLATYTPGNFYRDATVTWGPNTGNFGSGIARAVLRTGYQSVSAVRPCGAWQIGFSPAIPKDDTKVLDLVFRHTWARKTL